MTVTELTQALRLWQINGYGNCEVFMLVEEGGALVPIYSVNADGHSDVIPATAVFVISGPTK